MSTTFRRGRSGLYLPRGPRAYDVEILADAPALYLKLDETSGTTATDSSGNSHHGTHTSVTLNQASLRTDGVGKSARYNGTSAFTAVASGAWMNSVAITVECRLIRDGSADHFIASRWGTGSSTHRPWLFAVNSSGKLSASINSGSPLVAGSTTLSSSVPQTVAMVADGTNVKLYVNGVLDGSAAGLIDIGRNIDDIEIGRAALGAFGPGKEDELSFYTTALSAARLAVHHAAA